MGGEEKSNLKHRKYTNKNTWKHKVQSIYENRTNTDIHDEEYICSHECLCYSLQGCCVKQIQNVCYTNPVSAYDNSSLVFSPVLSCKQDL